jgi:hypothetical protein
LREDDVRERLDEGEQGRRRAPCELKKMKKIEKIEKNRKKLKKLKKLKKKKLKIEKNLEGP